MCAVVVGERASTPPARSGKGRHEDAHHTDARFACRSDRRRARRSVRVGPDCDGGHESSQGQRQHHVDDVRDVQPAVVVLAGHRQQIPGGEPRHHSDASSLADDGSRRLREAAARLRSVPGCPAVDHASGLHEPGVALRLDSC